MKKPRREDVICFALALLILIVSAIEWPTC